jgi:hypothetical protein
LAADTLIAMAVEEGHTWSRLSQGRAVHFITLDLELGLDFDFDYNATTVAGHKE